MKTRAEKIVTVWIRPLHHCWKPLVWFWITILLGVGVNVGSSWLTTQRWNVHSTPLGWITEHPTLTLPLAAFLLLFTGLARLASVQAVRQTDGSAAQFVPLSPALVQRNRERMHQRLTQWYQDYLSDSLQHAVWLDLDLADKPDALYNPVALAIQNAHLPARPLPAGTSIVQVYDEARQELLILGEPGAGKSIHLYTLAQHLLTLTETDQEAPLPIVFALSSWAQHREPLHTWMAEQLTQIYQVPKRLACQWIHNQQIIPLLDGLDEMEEPFQPLCIAVINHYHLEYLGPLVVCSRSAEYAMASQSEQFALQRAVVVQPLTATQIETTLAKGGKVLASLRAAYKHNAALRSLAAAPLLLNLLILTYRGVSMRDLPTKSSVLQQQVFEQYVTRMIIHKGDTTRYSLTHTCRWLTFLAQQMRLHNQTLFAVEVLQPTWLAKRECLSYRWSIGLILGLIGGLIGGLLFEQTFGLIFWLIIGLSIGLSETRNKSIVLAERIQWSWKDARFWLIFGLINGLIDGLIFGLIAGPIIGLIIGLIVGLLIGSILGLSVGLKLEQVIKRDSLSPGEGLRRSLKNGLIGGLSGGLSGGLILGLAVKSREWINGSASIKIDEWVNRWVNRWIGTEIKEWMKEWINRWIGTGTNKWMNEWICAGLVGGLTFGLIAGLAVGLFALLQHFVLRFWLWRKGSLPFQLLAFLEDARARHLLKRVGGTYQFMHRLLLDYFADNEFS